MGMISCMPSLHWTRCRTYGGLKKLMQKLTFIDLYEKSVCNFLNATPHNFVYTSPSPPTPKNTTNATESKCSSNNKKRLQRNTLKFVLSSQFTISILHNLTIAMHLTSSSSYIFKIGHQLSLIHSYSFHLATEKKRNTEFAVNLCIHLYIYIIRLIYTKGNLRRRRKES